MRRVPCWLAGLALLAPVLPAPAEDATAPRKRAWTETRVSDEARKHWSFQPLQRATPPVVRDTAWPKSNLDRFVLAAQEAAGLTPNPRAARQQLIRRAYFDLIGL